MEHTKIELEGMVNALAPGQPRCDHPVDQCGCHVRSRGAGMKTGSARFHEILGELGALHDKKQTDYGRATGGIINVTNAITGSQGYFRIRLQ